MALSRIITAHNNHFTDTQAVLYWLSVDKQHFCLVEMHGRLHPMPVSAEDPQERAVACLIASLSFGGLGLAAVQSCSRCAWLLRCRTCSIWLWCRRRHQSTLQHMQALLRCCSGIIRLDGSRICTLQAPHQDVDWVQPSSDSIRERI